MTGTGSSPVREQAYNPSVTELLLRFPKGPQHRAKGGPGGQPLCAPTGVLRVVGWALSRRGKQARPEASQASPAPLPPRASVPPEASFPLPAHQQAIERGPDPRKSSLKDNSCLLLGHWTFSSSTCAWRNNSTVWVPFRISKILLVCV